MPKQPNITAVKRQVRAALGPLLRGKKVGILKRKLDGNRKLGGSEILRGGKVSRG